MLEIEREESRRWRRPVGVDMVEDEITGSMLELLCLHGNAQACYLRTCARRRCKVLRLRSLCSMSFLY